MQAKLYPVNLLLSGKTCLVVGGGRVALGKTRELLVCQAQVRLVAPEICAELRELAAATQPDPASLTLHERPYQTDDLNGCAIAIAATGQAAVNQQVYDDGQRAGVLVNSADDPQRCDFYLPARLRQGDLLVAISTGGQSPAMASWLKRQLEQLLGGELPELEAMLELVAEVRAEIMAVGTPTEALNWAAALDSGIYELVKAGELVAAKEQLRQQLLADG